MAAGLKGHAAKPRGGPRATVAIVATLLTIGFFFFFSSSQPKDKVAPQDVLDKRSTGIPSSSVTTDEAIGKTKSLAEEEVSEEEEAAELVDVERQDELPRSQQDARENAKAAGVGLNMRQKYGLGLSADSAVEDQAGHTAGKSRRGKPEG
eukprot:SM000017S02862  [mRNA]  locus=s17:708256:709023:+ [translate_table: standard]